MSMWNRLKAKWWLLTEVTDSYERRTYVEKRLRDCARGARPLPTAEECREWGNKLGIPTTFSRRMAKAESAKTAGTNAASATDSAESGDNE